MIRTFQKRAKNRRVKKSKPLAPAQTFPQTCRLVAPFVRKMQRATRQATVRQTQRRQFLRQRAPLLTQAQTLAPRPARIQRLVRHLPPQAAPVPQLLQTTIRTPDLAQTKTLATRARDPDLTQVRAQVRTRGQAAPARTQALDRIPGQAKVRTLGRIEAQATRIQAPALTRVPAAVRIPVLARARVTRIQVPALPPAQAAVPIRGRIKAQATRIQAPALTRVLAAVRTRVQARALATPIRVLAQAQARAARIPGLAQTQAIPILARA